MLTKDEIDAKVRFTVFGDRPLHEISVLELPIFSLENMDEYLFLAISYFPAEVNEISAGTGKTRREVYEEYFIMSFHRLLGELRKARMAWLDDHHPKVFDDIERIMGII